MSDGGLRRTPAPTNVLPPTLNPCVADMSERCRPGILLLTLLGLLTPCALEAQVRRGRAVDPDRPPWMPISIGPRAGYDERARGMVLGAQIHLPILRNGLVELVPTADVVFPNNAREYQYNLELVYVSGGRTGGLYGGGGVGYRDTVLNGTPADPRNTIFGYSLVLGVRSGIADLFQTQLELRWIFLEDTNVRPVPVTLGINFPLWRGFATEFVGVPSRSG